MSIAFVQAKSGTNGSGKTSQLTLDSDATNGNAIIVASSSYGGSGAYSCSDNKGNTYTLIAQKADGGGNQNVCIFLALNIAGGSGLQVTTDRDTPVNYQRFAVIEYSGVATASAFDDDSVGGATGTAASTGNVPVAGVGEMIVGILTQAAGTQVITPDAGNERYEDEDAGTSVPVSVVDLLNQGSAAAVTWTIANSVAWLAAGASIKPGASVPTAPSDLAVTSTTSSAINLSWSDNSANETGFTIQYDTDSAFPDPTEIDVQPSDTETAAIAGLVAGMTYYIRVRAYNGSGASDWAQNVGATHQYVSAITAVATLTQSTAHRGDTIGGTASGITPTGASVGGVACTGFSYSAGAWSAVVAPGTPVANGQTVLVTDGSNSPTAGTIDVTRRTARWTEDGSGLSVGPLIGQFGWVRFNPDTSDDFQAAASDPRIETQDADNGSADTDDVNYGLSSTGDDLATVNFAANYEFKTTIRGRGDGNMVACNSALYLEVPTGLGGYVTIALDFINDTAGITSALVGADSTASASTVGIDDDADHVIEMVVLSRVATVLIDGVAVISNYNLGTVVAGNNGVGIGYQTEQSVPASPPGIQITDLNVYGSVLGGSIAPMLMAIGIV